MSELYPVLDNNFSKSEPIVLPNTGGIPREIPLVILNYENWALEFAHERTNIRWMSLEKEPPSLKNFIDTSVGIFDKTVQTINCPVGRLALIVMRFVKDDSPGLFIAEHFCQKKWLKEPFNRPENFELHSHKKFPLIKNEIDVNSWVRNKSMTAHFPDNRKETFLSVEQDLNTLAELAHSSHFTTKGIKRFFNKAEAAMGLILQKYYPNV